MRLKPMVSAIIFLRFIRFRLNLHAAEAGGVSGFHTVSLGGSARAIRVDSKTPTSSEEPAGVLASSIFSVLRLPSIQQDYIPSPSADMLMLRIINLRAVAEFVAVLVRLLRFFVVERDGINTELGESVQLR